MIQRPDAGWWLLMVVACLAWSSLAEPRRARAQGHDRPAGPLHKTRSAVMARQGMAATSQPLATATAIRVLQQGGNAVDAAIAANAVLGVVEPMSCGIGGDLFAIVWDAKTERLIGLNASGRAPGAATIELFRAKGLATIPVHGPMSWSVPGCVDGWDQLRRRFGTRSLDELLAPAIAYADLGFPVSEIIADDWKDAEPSLLADPHLGRLLPARRTRAAGRGGLPQPGPGAVAAGHRTATAATPSTRGRWPTRSCGIRSPPAACSATRTSPSTPARSSTRSRPIIAATTSGSCRPIPRGSPRSRCSTCSSRSTSRRWGRSRPRRCT